MGTFFIGLAAGIYIAGVLIVGFMNGMGGVDNAPSALLWPIRFVRSFWRKS